MAVYFKYFFESVGVIAVLTAIVIFLSKTLLNQLFLKEIVKFKSNLEKENQSQLLELKAKTEILFHEYKENIANLSGERIKAVKEIHNKFIDAYASYTNITAIWQQTLSN